MCSSQRERFGESPQAHVYQTKLNCIRAIVLYPGAMATNWGAFSPEARQEGKPNEAPPTRALPPERVADMIAWLAASPSEFVLTEAIVLPIEEGLP